MFATYQLQTNYRSNQEILDFANIALKNIEANQYANIQLRANSFINGVTKKSFTNKVEFHFEYLNKATDFNDNLESIITKEVKQYIDKKLKAGEQVAFLAYTRQHIKLVEDIIKKMYPGKQIANLVPEKMYNSTVFSSFIKQFWNEIKFVPTKKVMYTIGQTLMGKLKYLVYDEVKSAPMVRGLLDSWYDEDGPIIMQWQNQYNQGTMPFDDLFEKIKTNMLQFEIRHNAIKQALLSARNEENKNRQDIKNSPFVVSTIHSAKGLEFDNVVIIYHATDLDEEKKRMYYVALTRAMRSEFVLAYGVYSSPQIEADYNSIVEMLDGKTPVAVVADAEESKEKDEDNIANFVKNIKNKAAKLEQKTAKKNTNNEDDDLPF